MSASLERAPPCRGFPFEASGGRVDFPSKAVGDDNWEGDHFCWVRDLTSESLFKVECATPLRVLALRGQVGSVATQWLHWRGRCPPTPAAKCPSVVTHRLHSRSVVAYDYVARVQLPRVCSVSLSFAGLQLDSALCVCGFGRLACGGQRVAFCFACRVGAMLVEECVYC